MSGKNKRKITTRERWILAIAPAALISGVYLFGFAGDLSAKLEKENKHMATALAPSGPAGPPPALLQAKAGLEDATRQVAERQATLNELEQHVESLPKNLSTAADEHDRAHEIEVIGAIFARNGLTPAISESVGEGDAAEQSLLAVIAPKLEGETSPVRPLPRVWHCILDDSPAHFQRALAEVNREAPSVVPLTMNLVYNPENNGQTRLLELWLLY